MAVPLEQLVGLVRGQPATLDQFPGERFRIGETRLEGLQFLELLCFEQPVLAKGLFFVRSADVITFLMPASAAELHRALLNDMPGK